MLILFSYF